MFTDKLCIERILYMNELLTTEELAKYLKITPTQIHNLKKERKIPAPARCGGRSYRWFLADIVSWLREETQNAQD